MKKVKAPFHTTPAKFENAALFLRLGLPSKLICHENGALAKTLFKPEEFETLRVSVWMENTAPVFLKHKSKNTTGDCCLFRFLCCSVDGKHLLRFRSENVVFQISSGPSLNLLSSVIFERRKSRKFVLSNGESNRAAS